MKDLILAVVVGALIALVSYQIGHREGYKAGYYAITVEANQD